MITHSLYLSKVFSEKFDSTCMDKLQHLFSLYRNQKDCFCRSHDGPIEDLCQKEKLWLAYVNARDSIIRGSIKTKLTKDEALDIFNPDEH